MLKRLELQSMRADLSTITRSLEQHTREQDPLGWRQFQRRAEQLRAKIAEFENTPVRTAHVALFFGGRPVVGSYGIDASFSGRVIDQFQGIVSTRFAAKVRPLAARGPVPNRGQSELLVRDVARGSFGFMLEENAGDQLVDSPLREVVAEVVDLIYRVGAPDEEAYELSIEELDGRILADLKDFFEHLDRSGATMKIVDDDREFSLPRDAIQRGRERTEGLRIVAEEPLRAEGSLYLLPAAKRFELIITNGQTLSGSISASGMIDISDDAGIIRPEFAAADVIAILSVKTVRAPNRDDKRTYRLDEVTLAR